MGCLQCLPLSVVQLPSKVALGVLKSGFNYIQLAEKPFHCQLYYQKSKPLALVLEFKMSFLYYCTWYLSLWPQSAACRVAHLAQFFRASRSENEPKLKLGSPLLLPQIRVIHKMCCYQQTNFVSFKSEKQFCLITLEQHAHCKKSFWHPSGQCCCHFSKGSLIGGNFICQKNPLQDLLSSLNAVISTNERH